MKATLSSLTRAALYLSSVALNGVTPKSEYLLGIDVNEVYAFSARHSIGALVTKPLSELGLASEEAVSARRGAIRKIMLFDAEREEILRTLEESGIRYMSLKGVYLKEKYH